MKWLIFFGIVFFLNISSYSKDITNDLIKAVEHSDKDYIISIINSDLIFDIKRKEREFALKKAAELADDEVFSLLAPYVSKKGHREAYYILIKKNPRAKLIYNYNERDSS